MDMGVLIILALLVGGGVLTIVVTAVLFITGRRKGLSHAPSSYRTARVS